MGKNMIDNALNFDVIEAAENMSGKSVEYFNEDEITALVAMNFLTSKIKKQRLMIVNDTYFHIPWNDFLQLLRKNGFKNGLTYNFEDTNNKDRKEEAILYYREDGLVIWAESYSNKTCINSGNLYGELLIDEETFNDRDMPNCSETFFDHNKIAFSYDVREGLFNAIRHLKECGEFIPVWQEKRKFLWFLDFTETNILNYDYKKITMEKIKKSEDGLKAIVKNLN